MLGNAIKFAPKEGMIQVHLGTASDKQLILQITDNGQGISKEELPYIFDAFYQGANSKNNMGTGIGLAFVKQMVERLPTAKREEPNLPSGYPYRIQRLTLKFGLKKVNLL